MNRINFYHKETVNLIEELDFLHNSLSGFTMKYDPGYYRVKASDLMRPDMISYMSYGTPHLWWVIMLVNEIENPLVDLEVGQLLIIPSKLDIADFQKRYRVRRQR